MSEVERPKIVFPCPDYPIKVLGNADEQLLGYVIEVMNKHCEGFDTSRIKQNQSNKGRFVSYTVFITATGKQQLSDIFEDLKKNSSVRMVL